MEEMTFSSVPHETYSGELPSKEMVLDWVMKHPGTDSEGVANAFGIGPVASMEIIDGLLREGLLEFDE